MIILDIIYNKYLKYKFFGKCYFLIFSKKVIKKIIIK